MNLYPEDRLDGLLDLTDETGIIQHTKYSIIDRRHGYTSDDNARALVACMKYLRLHDDLEVRTLVNTYLSFLFYMQKPNGKLHNLLSYDRDFLDKIGSEECMGRSLWACGYAISTNLSESYKITAKEIFDKCFKHVSSFKSLRAKSYSILGLCYYYETFPHNHNLSKNI